MDSTYRLVPEADEPVEVDPVADAAPVRVVSSETLYFNSSMAPAVF
jgi:hypothetical protein